MDDLFLLAFTATFLALSAGQQVVKKCNIKDGNEPNFEDGGCETYWQCKNYQGSLVPCEVEGHQFHFQKRVCLPNGQVWCQWQHQKVEEWLEREQSNAAQQKVLRKKVRHVYHTNRAANQHSDRGYDYDDGNDYEYKVNYEDEKPNDYEDVYGDDSEYEYPQVPDMAPSGGKDYVCQTEYGHEPNLKDEQCESFWRCDEYMGSLIDCQKGLLYDYHAKACRHHTEVNCISQMDAFMNTQPKHWTESRPTSKVGQKESGLTIVHHYYHGKTRPRLDSTGDLQQGSPFVRHVMVNGNEVTDSQAAPLVSQDGQTRKK